MINAMPKLNKPSYFEREDPLSGRRQFFCPTKCQCGGERFSKKDQHFSGERYLCSCQTRTVSYPLYSPLKPDLHFNIPAFVNSNSNPVEEQTKLVPPLPVLRENYDYSLCTCAHVTFPFTKPEPNEEQCNCREGLKHNASAPCQNQCQFETSNFQQDHFAESENLDSPIQTDQHSSPCMTEEAQITLPPLSISSSNESASSWTTIKTDYTNHSSKSTRSSTPKESSMREESSTPKESSMREESSTTTQSVLTVKSSTTIQSETITTKSSTSKSKNNGTERADTISAVSSVKEKSVKKKKVCTRCKQITKIMSAYEESESLDEESLKKYKENNLKDRRKKNKLHKYDELDDKVNYENSISKNKKYEERMSEAGTDTGSDSLYSTSNTYFTYYVQEHSSSQETGSQARCKNADYWAYRFDTEENMKKIKEIMDNDNFKNCFMSTAESIYPGIKIGHKNCIIKHTYVPGNLSWLYTAKEGAGKLKPDLNWRPGAIRPDVASIMSIIKRKNKNFKPMYSMNPGEINLANIKKDDSEEEFERRRMLKQKENVKKVSGTGKGACLPDEEFEQLPDDAKLVTIIPGDETPSEERLARRDDRPTFHLHKTHGKYFISMHGKAKDVTEAESKEEVLLSFDRKALDPCADDADRSSPDTSTNTEDSMEMDFTTALAMARRRDPKRKVTVQTTTKSFKKI